jgi:hypothetical protein
LCFLVTVFLPIKPVNIYKIFRYSRSCLGVYPFSFFFGNPEV